MCKLNFPFLEREFLLRYKGKHRTSPGGPVVETPHSQCRGSGSVPGWGTRSCMLQLRACMWPLRCGTDQKNKKRKEGEKYQAGFSGAHQHLPLVLYSLSPVPPSLPLFLLQVQTLTCKGLDLQGPPGRFSRVLRPSQKLLPPALGLGPQVGSLVDGLSPP